MSMHRFTRRLWIAAVTVGLAACSASPAQSGIQTGMPELDSIVAAVMGGDAGDVRSFIEFTESQCTTAEGLGGPPKCTTGEAAGTAVEVLPILGPEGGFIRKTEIDTWQLPKAGALYAAYEVSDAAYSDPDYPAGDYALVFAGADDTQSSFTLQVRGGRILRVDYGPGPNPEIRVVDVARYLVEP